MQPSAKRASEHDAPPPQTSRAAVAPPPRSSRRRRVQAGVAEVLGAEHVLDEAEHHPDAGGAEADVPVDALTEIAADQRRDERAEVDAHVEDREAGVAPLVVVRVELADDHADVALEQAGAEDDQDQAEIERRAAPATPC